MKRQPALIVFIIAVLLGAVGPASPSPLLAVSPLDIELPTANTIDSGNDIDRTDAPKASLAARRDATRPGNPLWAIPLITLTETRERPLFSPSRQPPAPVIAQAPVVAPRAAPKIAAPETPHLTLIGTIAGGAEGFGLFLDPASKAVIRLKTGAAYQGWLLRAVHERDVVLEKNFLSTTVSLPAPEMKGVSASPSDGERPHRPLGGPAFAR